MLYKRREGRIELYTHQTQERERLLYFKERDGEQKATPFSNQHGRKPTQSYYTVYKKKRKKEKGKFEIFISLGNKKIRTPFFLLETLVMMRIYIERDNNR